MENAVYALLAPGGCNIPLMNIKRCPAGSGRYVVPFVIVSGKFVVVPSNPLKDLLTLALRSTCENITAPYESGPLIASLTPNDPATSLKYRRLLIPSTRTSCTRAAP